MASLLGLFFANKAWVRAVFQTDIGFDQLKSLETEDSPVCFPLRKQWLVKVGSSCVPGPFRCLVYSHQGSKRVQRPEPSRAYIRRFAFRQLDRQQRDLCLSLITAVGSWEDSSITSLPLVPLAQLLKSPLPSSNSALQQGYRDLEACLPSQPAVVLLAKRRLCLGFFVATASRSTTPSLSQRSDINLLLVPLHPKLGRIPEPTNRKLPGGAFIQQD